MFGFILLVFTLYPDTNKIVAVSQQSKNLSEQEITDILLCDKQFWKNNSPIKICLLKSYTGTNFLSFIKEELNFTSLSFKRFYIVKTFKNEIHNPVKRFEHSENLLKYLSVNQDAIGFVSKSEAVKSGLNIVYEF